MLTGPALPCSLCNSAIDGTPCCLAGEQNALYIAHFGCLQKFYPNRAWEVFDCSSVADLLKPSEEESGRESSEGERPLSSKRAEKSLYKQVTDHWVNPGGSSREGHTHREEQMCEEGDTSRPASMDHSLGYAGFDWAALEIAEEDLFKAESSDHYPPPPPSLPFAPAVGHSYCGKRVRSRDNSKATARFGTCSHATCTCPHLSTTNFSSKQRKFRSYWQDGVDDAPKGGDDPKCGDDLLFDFD